MQMKSEKKISEKALIFAVLFAMLAFVSVECTTAVTISVPDDYAKIQCAVDNATAGDTVVVKRGTYYEKVNVNKTLSLRGVDKPLVDASGSGSVITLSADGITLEGFTVTNSGRLWRDAGIRITSNNNIITSNTARNNNGKGIHLDYSCNNTITGNTACNNDHDGIHLDYSCNNNTISGNNVSNNKHAGIFYLQTSGNNNIIGNNVSNNEFLGIYLRDSNNNLISNNHCTNNGIYLSLSNNNKLTGMS